MNEKIIRILKSDRYFRFLKNRAKQLSIKYNVCEEDILQDHFLNLIEGRNLFIEQTAMETIRKEYNRGIVGKRKARKVTIDLVGLKFIREKKNFLTDIEFMEYLIDLKKVTTEYEYKVIQLALMGFGRGEVDRNTFGSHDKFSKSWNKWIKNV